MPWSDTVMDSWESAVTERTSLGKVPTLESSQWPFGAPRRPLPDLQLVAPRPFSMTQPQNSLLTHVTDQVPSCP